MKTNRWSSTISTILDLTIGCPLDGLNPPFCPLYQARKLDGKGKLMWTLSLPEGEIENITAYHRICSKCRLTDATNN